MHGQFQKRPYFGENIEIWPRYWPSKLKSRFLPPSFSRPTSISKWVGAPDYAGAGEGGAGDGGGGVDGDGGGGGEQEEGGGEDEEGVDGFWHLWSLCWWWGRDQGDGQDQGGQASPKVLQHATKSILEEVRDEEIYGRV